MFFSWSAFKSFSFLALYLLIFKLFWRCLEIKSSFLGEDMQVFFWILLGETTPTAAYFLHLLTFIVRGLTQSPAFSSQSGRLHGTGSYTSCYVKVFWKSLNRSPLLLRVKFGTWPTGFNFTDKGVLETHYLNIVKCVDREGIESLPNQLFKPSRYIIWHKV